MKIKSPVFVLVLFFGFCLSMSAQHSLGVKACAGLSYMHTRFASSSPQLETNTFYPMPSGQIGIFRIIPLKENLILGTDALIVPIYGHEYLKLTLIDMQGKNVGESESHVYRYVYYAGLPVYVGYKMNTFTALLGLQTNLAIASGGFAKERILYNGIENNSNSNANKLGIRKYDVGLHSGFLYALSDKYSIETNYYFGLTNILTNSFRQYANWKVQQLTVGVRYTISSGAIKTPTPE